MEYLDRELKASLCYITSLKPAWATRRHCQQITHISRLSNMNSNKEGNWIQCSDACILEAEPGGIWVWGELELWGALEFKKRGGARTGEREGDNEREFYARLAKREKEFAVRSKEQSRRGDAPRLLTSANSWGEQPRSVWELRQRLEDRVSRKRLYSCPFSQLLQRRECILVSHISFLRSLTATDKEQGFGNGLDKSNRLSWEAGILCYWKWLGLKQTRERTQLEETHLRHLRIFSIISDHVLPHPPKT